MVNAHSILDFIKILVSTTVFNAVYLFLHCSLFMFFPIAKFIYSYLPVWLYLYGSYCVDVPLRNCSLTPARSVSFQLPLYTSCMPIMCDFVCKFTVCISIDGREVDVQYSNWQRGYQVTSRYGNCVLFTQNNEWLPYSCNSQQRYVCQS